MKKVEEKKRKNVCLSSIVDSSIKPEGCFTPSTLRSSDVGVTWQKLIRWIYYTTSTDRSKKKSSDCISSVMNLSDKPEGCLHLVP